MREEMKPATADDVFDLLDAYAISAAVGTAMELGLFWLLEKQPLDTRGVAQALSIPINRCQYWLQLLHRVGLVEPVAADLAELVLMALFVRAQIG